MENPTDRHIVRTSKRDFSLGVELLLQKYRERLTQQLRIDYRFLPPKVRPSEHEIEECCDDAVLRVAQKIKDYDPEKSPLWAWLHFIAKRCISNMLSGKKSRAIEEPIGEREFPAREALKPIPKKQQRLLRRLEKEIEKLPPRQKAIIYLDMASGGTASAKEVAKRLGSNQNAVRVSRCLARKKLKRALGNLVHGKTER